MKASSKPFAVIIFGSPGSGKSTQADLLAKKYGIVHFNTGKFIEHFIYNQNTRNTDIAKKARKIFESGKLVEPKVVLNIIKKQTDRLAMQGESVVFSGSPRTEYETVGDKHNPGIVKILKEQYGKDRVLYFELQVAEKDAVQRNTKRLVCSACGLPLLGAALNLKLKNCPFCGGKVYKRKLDDVKIISKRFEVYHNETAPIFPVIKKMGYTIHAVPATQLPFKVLEVLSKKIDSLLK